MIEQYVLSNLKKLGIVSSDYKFVDRYKRTNTLKVRFIGKQDREFSERFDDILTFDAANGFKDVGGVWRAVFSAHRDAWRELRKGAGRVRARQGARIYRASASGAVQSQASRRGLQLDARYRRSSAVLTKYGSLVPYCQQVRANVCMP